LRTYGLDQQGENFKLKTEILAYQPKQGGHLRVAKEELQELKVDLRNLDSRISKENLQ
jgi:prephenate dehydratase